MVPSSTDIILQKGQISQSEASTINICDVNIMALQHARVSAMKISLRQYFRLLLSTNQASCQADGL